MATTNEYPGIDTGFRVNAVTFTADGSHLVGGSDRLVGMWRVNDGEQVATMSVTGDVVCVAASNDGSWIAGGTRDGDVLVWNAKTHERLFANRNGDTTVLDVDFSPNSARLVSAHGRSGTATIWNLATCKRVRALKQKALVAKYSPQGDKIATATNDAISIWGSKNGRLLIKIPVPVQRWRSLVWHAHRVFVQTSNGTIEQINASRGSTVSEWSIPDADNWSCVALSQRGQFLAYSAQKTIALWNTASRFRLYSSILHTHDICSIAWSSDGRLFTMAAERKIIVFRLISEPELNIDSVTLDAWKYGQLTNAESLLSAAIPTSKSRHHVLANRALVRARLGQWNAALADAEESLEIQQSVIGYIAKGGTLIGKGEKDDGHRVCDMACRRYSEHVILLRLIEAVFLFMAGEHVDAISHMDDLITDSWVDPELHVVQAYTHLLLANKHFEGGDCEQAIRLFEAAQNKLRTHTHQPPLVVTLVSGWSFDDLATTIHQGLCEALLAAGRSREAIESVQRMVDQVINMVEPTKTWVSEFKCRCHNKLGDSAMDVDQYDEAILQYTIALSLNHTAPQDLLLKRSKARMGRGVQEDALNDAKEWARLVLTSSSWQDALVAVRFTLEKFIVHRAVCEHLEITGHITDAVECFHQISSESVQTADKEQESWIRDFKTRFCCKLEVLGDRAMGAEQYEEAASQYTVAMSLDPVRPQILLKKRSNAWVGKGAREDALNDAKNWVGLMLTCGSWKDALASATGFELKKFTIHQVICEHLEATGRVTDAIACFHRMSSNMIREVNKRQVNWARDFKSRCRDKLEGLGDVAVNAGQYTEAISQYKVAISLDPVNSQHLLMKRSNAWVGKGALKDALNDAKEWARLMLKSASWNDALVGAVNFKLARSTIYQVVCDHLEMTDCVTDAVACFQQISNESLCREQANWACDFKSRCRNKLEGLGDVAVNAGQYTEAISHYTDAISLDPVNSQHLLMKRSNAWMGKGAQGDARNDAREWAGLMLKSGSWNNALVAAADLALGGFTICQSVCEHLEMTGRVADAAACFHQMSSDPSRKMDWEQANWAQDFKFRCRDKLEGLGDGAVNAGQYDEAISQYKVAISLDPVNSQHLLMKRGNAWVAKGAWEDALNDAKEWARLMLKSASWNDALVVAVNFKLARFTIYQVICDHLEMTDRVTDAVVCFQQISSESLRREQANWACDFKSRCRDKLEDLGDSAVNAREYAEAVSQYTAAMLLDPPNPQHLLVKRSNAWVGKGAREDALSDAEEWTRLMLTSGSWQDALAVAVDFKLGKFMIYQAICEYLEMTGRVTDAAVCFHEISSEPTREMSEAHVDWTRNFRTRCRITLKDLGDSAVKAERYDEAVTQYTAAILLGPNAQDLLTKRSKAFAAKGMWEDALNDANKVIELDPSSSSGYKRKYVALLGMERHDGAIDAFDTMLLKMSESSDPNIRNQSSQYVRPEQTKNAIRESIQKAIHDSPSVLINTLSGRLCDKSQQASAFESTPAFATLVASMTTDIDYARIDQEVGEFYRYATLSHTWEGKEPLYGEVVKIVVYDLKTLPTHEKLKMFCNIVRDNGFKWAWSDTCCINKGDHFVLQEALISMFKWYEGSAMTIIFLCDVDRLAKLGALTRSRWNSRGWTFQEYHASKVVQIYTKDWTPYLGLAISNHKESPEIMSEMEQATGISARALMTLRPGLSDIREKLRLASARKTTRVEDAAYSLLGIFSTSLPVTYGEGDKALGKLLSQLLMSSGDTSILAWSGRSGSFNSCLPSDIAVFSQPLTSYIPTAVHDAEMATIAASLPDLNLSKRLYDLVKELPTPIFAGQRMRLPCLVFKITTLRDESGVFHAQAGVLGTVEIKTRQNLAELHSPRLIYPWIDILLDQHAAGSTIKAIPEEILFDPSQFESLSLQTRGTRFVSFPQQLSPVRPAPNTTLPPLTVLPMEEQTRVLQFITRLRQPFGALLLSSPRPNAAEYKRVAAEDLIMVEVGEITPAVLEELIQSVRVLNVL